MTTVETFIAQRSKKLATEDQKREDSRLYVQALSGINQQLYGNAAFAQKAKQVLAYLETTF